ncbi:imidazoleglycerol-phosphate dehydratase [Dethiosulfatibacter aminovorans DSM 17477]|uniref:Imidazoleglycerol-phosphate dehydratase n=1 Tax=Dethiosulfatibacter aminovorans DSM 17477 TaxID=1121476 RepID=A0A1M6H3U4_9FIRM|nr:imidazoleglycerol-phosphate dehydratase HisB [Dethiosulfatibacter aminovorans]SHJ16860.1 imidazoleglycerol-phosphate dehydratase [Dethiosulfatibacter aminovorans DSM 17477]
MREASIERKTKETEIEIKINIDGSGKADIDTGIGFFDHMLDLFAFHGKFDLTVKCRGDLDVDTHHTVEDIGISLGKAFFEAMGDKKGIRRYSTVFLPMDEALARVALDISGRAYLVYDDKLSKDYLGRMDTQNFREFLRAFSNEARITLHAEVLYGDNDHHKIEAVFKGIGRALAEASQVIDDRITSSKGVL